jgi:DNA-binding HxlR family transcriptional regulator
VVTSSVSVYESTKEILERIADKWTVMIICRLSGGTRRFSELRREMPGISQKSLTQTLRSLERDGLVTRTVFAEVPPRVEYALTELGRSLEQPLYAVQTWAEKNIDTVRGNQEAFDLRQT